MKISRRCFAKTLLVSGAALTAARLGLGQTAERLIQKVIL